MTLRDRLICWTCILCLFTNTLYGRKRAPRWWSPNAAKPAVTCSEIPGLFPKQLRYCRDNIELLEVIIRGANLGINECKNQFKDRRWNCSTVPLHSASTFKRHSIFGRTIDKGTRESAFLRAIITAGVAYAITMECSSDHLNSCGCEVESKARPKEYAQSGRHWRWGGCNDDVGYGIHVTNKFVDPHLKPAKANSQMNKHNNDVGREVLKRNMHTKCKCHGLSGSCELETCWKSMPTFRRIGDILKQRYDKAIEVSVERRKTSSGRIEMMVPKLPTLPYPGLEDLINIDPSPDFCAPNQRKGILGTQGRRCNSKNKGLGSCKHLCCDRGYKTAPFTQTKRCNCTFHWCCHVTCDECVSTFPIQTCL